MKTLIIPIFGVPLTSALVLSSLNIDNDQYHHSRLVEVYFYSSSSSSSSSDQIERIKVWIEDLNDFSKFQFYKNSGENKWLNINKFSADEQKKYLTLAEIARYFFFNQHFLNIGKALSLINDKENKIKIDCTGTCKENINCCIKDCVNLPEDHKKFFYYLNNLNSAQTGFYLSPVQAHISLGEVKFDDLGKNQTNQTNQEKKISGSLVYSHVDYYYRTKSTNKLELTEEEKKYYKLSSSDSIINKKYFANYPTFFSLTLDDNGKIKEGSNENDLVKVHKKLRNNKDLGKLLEEKKDLKTCCCSDNSFECLFGSSFVKLEDSLDTIQKWVKDKEPCKQ